MIERFKEYSFINSVIEENIEKSSNFGLILRQEDIDMEKRVIIETFSKYGLKKMLDYTENEYNTIYRQITDEIFSRLEDQLRYYFYSTPKNEVKNRYNCHLNNIISEIFLKF